MQRYLRNIDWWLVGAVCALVGIGLMLIASATHSYAVARGEAWFVERQGIFFGINVLLVIFCLRFDYRLLQQIAKPLYIFNLVLLLAVMFVGHSALGAQRWIQIGVCAVCAGNAPAGFRYFAGFCRYNTGHANYKRV